MRSPAACAVALLALLICAPLRAGPSGTQIRAEVAKEEVLYQAKDASEGYTVDRSLSDYKEMLPGGFEQALAKLHPGERWLDIGAGQARAILDYYAAGPAGKARAVAISIEDRRTPLWYRLAGGLPREQLRYLTKRHLREYSLHELGRFQLITDVIGGFSYAEDLSVFIEKALGLLAVEGNFYTVLTDVRAEHGGNKPYYPGAAFSTDLLNADGSQGSVCAWLKSIRCVEVSCEPKAGWTPPIEAFRLTKVCAKVRVPALALLEYSANTPPDRRYRWLTRIGRR